MSYARFLSVELHIGALAKKHNKRDLHTALETLPKDLDAIYEDSMGRILNQDPEDIRLAKRVLSWLCHSPEDMTVEELQHTLAIEPGTKRLDLHLMIEENLLVSVCGGLITVEDKSKVVRLAHFTTQEYLMSVRQKHFPDAKLHILVCCLTYLLYDECRLDLCEYRKDQEHGHSTDSHCEISLEGSDDARARCCDCRRCQNRNTLAFRDYAARKWSFYARGDLE